MTNSIAVEQLSTDVLVVGGGPAGTWAAIKAAEAGVDVILADKGYTGASGATASVGTGVWYVDDLPELREAAMASRESLGGHLADREWMTRVLDETTPGWTNSPMCSATRSRSTRRAALSETICKAPNTCAGNGFGCSVLVSASSTTPRRWSFWSMTTAWCPGRRFWTVRRGGRCASRRRGSCSRPVAVRFSPRRSGVTSTPVTAHSWRWRRERPCRAWR